MNFYPVNYSQPHAIVVRCPDRRFRVAHRRFIDADLSLCGEDFWPLKTAGGVAALARPTQMQERFATLISDIELFVKHSPITKIVLINHEDCRQYDSFVDRKTNLHPERDDLFPAVRILARKFPQIEIRAYFAKFANAEKTQICFEEVAFHMPVRTEKMELATV